MTETEVADAFWEMEVPDNHASDLVRTIDRHYNGDNIGLLLGEKFRKERERYRKVKEFLR